jgi:hypothetical protein
MRRIEIHASSCHLVSPQGSLIKQPPRLFDWNKLSEKAARVGACKINNTKIGGASRGERTSNIATQQAANFSIICLSGTMAQRKHAYKNLAK